MDLTKLMDVAVAITKTKYFNVSNFILMSLLVRQDKHPAEVGGKDFRRKHPLASWFGTMLLCLAGPIIGNLVRGEPLVSPFKDHFEVMEATVIWYLVNHSPRDVIYRLVTWTPVHVLIHTWREFQRAHNVHSGVMTSFELYKDNYAIVCLLGTLKGSSVDQMRLIQKLVCGIWVPSVHEFTKPSFMTKASFTLSLAMILERCLASGAPSPVLYFAAVVFFIYSRISSIFLGFREPFVHLENVVCPILFGRVGGMDDTITNEDIANDDTADGDMEISEDKNSAAKKND